jgi:hypothetical protein
MKTTNNNVNVISLEWAVKKDGVYIASGNNGLDKYRWIRGAVDVPLAGSRCDLKSAPG